jgi:hypothetical protein
MTITFKHLMFVGSAIALSSFMLTVAGCEPISQNNNSGVELAVTPTSAVVSASSVTNIAFSAFGGTPPYTWSVNDHTIGFVAGNDNTAIYTAYALTGLNYVVVNDAASNSVSATVTQE